MRDSQRKRVYTAEVEAFDTDKKTDEPTLREVKEVERFVKKVFASKRVKKEWPLVYHVPVVKDGRGCRNALAHGTSAISVPIWARRKWVVLHELAHIITARYHKGVASHGWEYCRNYLRLVEIILGKEAHAKLEKSFLKHGVKFIKPNT